MQRNYIKSHASLRGFAALLVVIYHMQFGSHVRLFWEVGFFRRGYLWVDLFFILSGFVISYTAGLGRHGWPEIKAFWQARFARIYPLHFFALTLLVAVIAVETIVGNLFGKAMVNPQQWSSGSLVTLALQYTLLNGLFGQEGWNIPSWSISTEAVAYALFPLIALGKRWPYVVAAIAFYLWVGATTGVLDIVSGVAVLRCLAGFSLGMAICAARDRIAQLRFLGALQLVGLAFALIAMITGWNDVVAIPGFVLLVAATWTDRGVLCVPLKWPALVWLGDVSYSVYLNHFWVLEAWHFVASRALPRLGFDDATARSIEIGFGLVAVLVVSHVTWRWVEMPTRKYLLAKWRARPALVDRNPAP